MTTATLKNKNNTEERVLKAKQGIEIGLRVLTSIAGRHSELSGEIEAAKIETIAELGHGGVFKTNRLVWDYIDLFGGKAAQNQIAKAEATIESVNGALPQRKAEALKLIGAAKTDFEGRNFRDADFKAGRANQIIESIQKDSQVNADFAESLRRAHWGELEKLKAPPRRKKR